MCLKHLPSDNYEVFGEFDSDFLKLVLLSRDTIVTFVVGTHVGAKGVC